MITVAFGDRGYNKTDDAIVRFKTRIGAEYTRYRPRWSYRDGVRIRTSKKRVGFVQLVSFWFLGIICHPAFT